MSLPLIIRVSVATIRVNRAPLCHVTQIRLHTDMTEGECGRTRVRRRKAPQHIHKSSNQTAKTKKRRSLLRPRSKAPQQRAFVSAASSTVRLGLRRRARRRTLFGTRRDRLGLESSGAARIARHKLQDGAAQGTDLLRRCVGQGTDYVHNGVARATDATKTFADNNPIALAMATLALGVGIGMIVIAAVAPAGWWLATLAGPRWRLSASFCHRVCTPSSCAHTLMHRWPSV